MLMASETTRSEHRRCRTEPRARRRRRVAQNPCTGRFRTATSGFRYYNPSTERWISRDPLAERGGLSLFGFVGNDPIDQVDILGLQVSIDPADPKHPGGRCSMGQTCRDNLRLMVGLINSAYMRIETDFTPRFLKLARARSPIPPDQIYNPNVTDFRTSWNNHVQELVNTLARAAECVSVIGAQKKDGQCGCCKWFDEKRLRWREQEVERLKRQVPSTVTRSYGQELSGAFVESSIIEPKPAAFGAVAGAALLLLPGGEPEGAVLLGGCLRGL